MKLHIDPNDLTIGDLEDFEEVTGVSLQEALKPVPLLDENGEKVFDEKGRPITEVQVSTKTLKGLVWIIGRKENPSFSLTDARNVKVTSLEIESDEGDEQGNAEGGDS